MTGSQRKDRKAREDTLRRHSSGIGALDDILHGGFPAGNFYLLEGEPGTGKTTLALQFLQSGLRAGEQVLYITLSESKHELEMVAASHGWAEEFPILDMAPLEEAVSNEAQYTVFHPSEVELADTITELLKKVEEVKPVRCVIDSVSELRMLARDGLRYRRQILALKRYFAGRDCTVLLLDDRTGIGHDLQLQSIAHGVVTLENLPRDFGVSRRRVIVRKMRGARFREGYHDFNILTGGIEVYPRLIASEHKADVPRTAVPSGLAELDDLLGGGIDTGTSTLLMGPAGCGKSTLAMRYVLTAAERGDFAVIYAFDETREVLLDRSKGLGIDLRPHVETGKVRVEQIDPAELSPGEFVQRVRHAAEVDNAKVVVIDSLNGLMLSMPAEKLLTIQLHELVTFLNQKGLATLLTLAQQGLMGTNMVAPVDVSYLADSVILFRYFEALGEVRQAISAVKKRSGAHERTIRELSFSGGTIRVGEPLIEFDGVLTGVPKYRGAAATLEQRAKSRD